MGVKSAKAPDYEALLQAYFDELASGHTRSEQNPAQYRSGKIILELPLARRAEMLRCVLRTLCDFVNRTLRKSGILSSNYLIMVTLRGLVSRLLRAPLTLEENDIRTLISCAGGGHFPGEIVTVTAALRAAEEFANQHPLPKTITRDLQDLRAALKIDRPNATEPNKETAEHLQRIDILLGAPKMDITHQPLEIAEPWAAAAMRDIDALPPDQRKNWFALLAHLQSVDGAKPAKKWLAQAKALIESFGRDRFRAFLTAWLPLTSGKRTDHPPPASIYHPDDNLLFAESSHLTLKGLAWAASLIPEPDVSAALGDLGETCWKKVPAFGPRSKLAGNAVLWSLSAMAGEGANHAVAQLTRVNSKLKHASARKLADKAFNHAAESSGQTREDLEEIAVPTFNLTPAGQLSSTLGAFTLTLTIEADLAVVLTVTDAAGKSRKSIPAELKSAHAAELKALQRSQKDIQTTLAAQRSRIESMLRFPDRRWTFADWRTRYLAHPLLARLASRLIWKFTAPSGSFAALPVNGHLLRADGTPLPNPAPDATVQLWHPCTDTLDAVRSWRNFLVQRQITQPFKQAHREIYLLTDAERRTRSYSNRFAAHIIRQHQFNALCAARGWTYRLQGTWDGGSPVPTLTVPALNLQVEFWVEVIGVANHDGQVVSASGVALNLSTDQVRFHRLRPLQQLDLDQVHPQTFSEILRDVDLFIGVCSVGNDANWFDGGPGGRFRDYWLSVSFGDLTETAKTRKAVLETLLPRLAIAQQCSLTDKFLRVQGSLRAYKIHLGSGNILMEPNDQYLCIVANQSAKSRTYGSLYLPFEGDTLLSLILSKAFLLAADQKITDPSITRQIKP